MMRFGKEMKEVVNIAFLNLVLRAFDLKEFWIFTSSSYKAST